MHRFVARFDDAAEAATVVAHLERLGAVDGRDARSWQGEDPCVITLAVEHTDLRVATDVVTRHGGRIVSTAPILGRS
jgi:hypothetical protein